MMEEDNEEPSSCFFSKRAKFIPKKTPEELQAAAELLDKIREEEETMISDIVKMRSSNKKTTRKAKKKVKLHPSNDIEDSPSNMSEEKLSHASRKRLQKLREEQKLELQLVETENEKILSAMNVNSDYSVEDVIETAEEFEKITVLTVNYLSQVSRLKCYENDKFLHIFPKVAELFNLKVTEFLLCLKEKNIDVDDTPKSLKLTNHDILECIPYVAGGNSETDSGGNANAFKITFQTSDTRDKIDMLVHKAETMQGIMQRYSEQRNIPISELLFDFDGERLSGSETPTDLDMEPGSCVDVTILIATKKTKRNKRK